MYMVQGLCNRHVRGVGTSTYLQLIFLFLLDSPLGVASMIYIVPNRADMISDKIRYTVSTVGM